MMKKMVVSLLAVSALTACTNVKWHADEEETVRERRALTGFERVELLGPLDVKYEQADTFSVWVKAPKEHIKYVETRVDGNKLVVNMKGEGKIINFGMHDGDGVTVYVTSPDFLGVVLKGSGDFDCKRHLDTDRLDIQVKGSGDVEFNDVICDRIDVSLVGSGDVEVKNLVTRRSGIELVGSGDIKMNQRQAGQTDIVLKGSGDVMLHLDDCGTVNASVYGSGDITLRGQADRVVSNTRGSGDIDTSRLTVRQK